MKETSIVMGLGVKVGPNVQTGCEKAYEENNTVRENNMNNLFAFILRVFLFSGVNKVFITV